MLQRICLLGLALLLSACAPKKTEEVRDITPEAEAYYAQHPDRFGFKTLADLPEGLVWEDGQDQDAFASPHAKKGGILYDTITDFPRTLRTVGPDSNGGFRGIILDGNALSLLGQHPNTEKPFGGLAKQWAIGDDHRTVYFRLDPDARFSDGETISADNYFFSFFFFLSDYIKAPWYNNFYSTEYTNISRYDDHTISITLAEAKPDFLDRAGGLRPLPIEFYKELGEDYPVRYQWRFEPTTGAYELRDADIKKGRSITMRRIKDWWAADKKFYRGRYNPDAMKYSVVRDAGKAYELWLAGQLDLFALGLPEYWYDRSANAKQVHDGYIKRVTFYNQTPRPTWGVYVNTADTLMQNHDVRLGLAHALNWDQVIDFFFRGDFQRMRCYGSGYGRYTNPDIEPYPFDPEAAAEYFAKAGFTQRDREGVLTNPETQQRLEISVTASEGPLNGILVILKQEALKAGLQLNLDILDGTTAFKKMLEKKHQTTFMAFNVGGENYPRYWEMFHSVNAAPQTNNLCNLQDERIDALIDRYDRSTSEDEIAELSHQLQALVHSQACFLPGYEKPWYRVGFWRWLHFPEGFDVKKSSHPYDWGLFWIDTEEKADTLKAMQEGRKFEPSTKIYDQWRL